MNSSPSHQPLPSPKQPRQSPPSLSKSKKKKSSSISIPKTTSTDGIFTVTSCRKLPSRHKNPKLWSSYLLKNIPIRADYTRQNALNRADHEEVCLDQVKKWQLESEQQSSPSENPANFIFGLKCLLAAAEKREIEQLCLNPEIRQKIKHSWQTIQLCFNHAVAADGDLEKILSVIGFMNVHTNEVASPAAGRRPTALKEMRTELERLANQNEPILERSKRLDIDEVKYFTIIEKLAAFDRLQMIECGRLEDPQTHNIASPLISAPSVGRGAFEHINNDGDNDNDEKNILYRSSSQREVVTNSTPKHHRSNLQYSAFHFLQSSESESNIMLNFQKKHSTILPNDDNSDFARQSLELRQDLTMARLEEKQHLYYSLPETERRNIQRQQPAFFLFISPIEEALNSRFFKQRNCEYRVSPEAFPSENRNPPPPKLPLSNNSGGDDTPLLMASDVRRQKNQQRELQTLPSPLQVKAAKHFPDQTSVVGMEQ